MSNKRVLLVVRADIPQDPRRQLEWLEQRIFPREDYPKRTLVFVGISSYLHKLDEPWVFDAFDEYQDVYSKLRGEGFFTNTHREQRHFDFALLIHIRRDRASGMGYGLEETRGERCLLRAMFLAAHGNVLFGDWGLPLGTLPDVTREELLARRKLNQYIYPDVHHRLYEDLTANVPFTLVVDHFLTPVPEQDPGLPNSHMLAIQRAIEGTLFSSYQLKLAEWNAWWNMYFASDGYCLVYHRWIHMRVFQMYIIAIYVYFRAWTVSSSWLEIIIDSFGFAAMAVVYGVLATIGSTVAMTERLDLATVMQPFDGDAVFLRGTIALFVVRYATLMALALVFFNIQFEEPMDRIPVWQKMKSMRIYSVLLPICDVLACLTWKHAQRDIAGFLGLWTSMALADLTTMWVFVPFARNCIAVGFQAVLILAVLWFTGTDGDIAARLILELIFYVSPLFLWGRLQLHPELKRSLVVAPCISAVIIVSVSSITYMFA